MKEHDVENLEQEKKYQVIKLEEENADHSKKQEIINNLSKELDRIFSNAKQAIHDARTSEEADAAFNKAKNKANAVYEKTKKALRDFSEDDRVQDVIDSINGAFVSLKTTISENDTVQKASKKIDAFVRSDSVQNGLQNVKQTTLDLADKAHDGIKSLLSTKDKES